MLTYHTLHDCNEAVVKTYLTVPYIYILPTVHWVLECKEKLCENYVVTQTTEMFSGTSGNVPA